MADRPKLGRLVAWAVHLFTASGALLALLALREIVASRWTAALLWLLLAMAIDGIDGSLARRAQVEARLPRINGAALDLVVDYLTYVFVPTMFILEAGLVPDDVRVGVAAGILISSLYVFARSDMKSEDGYFRGFPALWNVVAIYIYILQPTPWVAAGLILLLIIMTFAPIYIPHPFRVKEGGALLPLVAVLWTVSVAALLWPDWTEPQRIAWQICSIAAVAILMIFGLRRSLRRPSRMNTHHSQARPD